MKPRALLTLRAALKLSLTLSGLLTLGGLARFSSYRPPPPAKLRFTLGSPADYLVSSVTAIPAARAWLVRDGGGCYALSGSCTHLGCTVAHSSTLFACPCHGSRFTLEGLVAQGPASRVLRHVQLSLSDDRRLVLDTSVEVPPTQRLTT